MDPGLSQLDTATIFVIDDDASVRSGLARLFRSIDLEVETHPDAREFLARPAYTGTGCLVLDVRMPDMSGPELQDWMAANDVGLPIVFLTGHLDVTSGVRAMKRGAVDYLLKPVDDELLIETVRGAIQRHAAQRASQERVQAIRAMLARLSRREHEVLLFVIAGLLNKQIADRLAISLKTVKAHRARVMEKMKVGSVAELVHLCDAVGLP
ncbi:MAG TPA: response regulator [Caldimonas sp.]|jgi:FixJ family two-component response regulator|nr:response regulator [Caldimonas sp.]HEX4232723.1 response regulator [Caldimonas sp.]